MARHRYVVKEPEKVLDFWDAAELLDYEIRVERIDHEIGVRYLVEINTRKPYKSARGRRLSKTDTKGEAFA